MSDKQSETRSITTVLLVFAGLCVVSSMSRTVEDWTGWIMVGLLGVVALVVVVRWLADRFWEWW